MEEGHEVERELSVKVRLSQVKKLGEKIKANLDCNGCRSEELVLLVGDMNINAREQPFKLEFNSYLSTEIPINRMSKGEEEVELFSEYDAFLNIFKEQMLELVDCAYLRYSNKHPITFGDGDTVLTDRSESESKQRLDYIMEVRRPNSSPENKVVIESCNVESFKVANKPYIQLSDHYGMSVEVALKK